MRYFNELSAGQHQKVMLARGLVQQPEILLLDEPTSNLDIKHQMSISCLLRKLSHDEGLLVIMICHDLNLAAKYSDSIIMMHEGRIFDVGTPRDVITVDNIKSVYDTDSIVIEDGNSPHVILIDHSLESVRSVSASSMCYSPKDC